MTGTGISPSRFSARIVALRFFFGMSCGREGMERFLRFRTRPGRLPRVPSAEAVRDAPMAAPGPGLRYRAAPGISHGAGLRAAGVCTLRVTGIDGERIPIHAEQGKGHKLMRARSAGSLAGRVARSAARRPAVPGQARDQPGLAASAEPCFPLRQNMAGIKKPAPLHTLRHGFAPRLLEATTDVRLIQVLLGHARLTATAQHTHGATKTVRDTVSPSGMPAGPQDQTMRRSLE